MSIRHSDRYHAGTQQLLTSVSGTSTSHQTAARYPPSSNPRRSKQARSCCMLASPPDHLDCHEVFAPSSPLASRRPSGSSRRVDLARREPSIMVTALTGRDLTQLGVGRLDLAPGIDAPGPGRVWPPDPATIEETDSHDATTIPGGYQATGERSVAVVHIHGGE